jgi:hypothetical protein
MFQSVYVTERSQPSGLNCNWGLLTACSGLPLLQCEGKLFKVNGNEENSGRCVRMRAQSTEEIRARQGLAGVQQWRISWSYSCYCSSQDSGDWMEFDGGEGWRLDWLPSMQEPAPITGRTSSAPDSPFSHRFFSPCLKRSAPPPPPTKHRSILICLDIVLD